MADSGRVRFVSDSSSPALSCQSRSVMQVTVERIEPSGGSTGPRFQHGFSDRHYRCGFTKSLLESERTLQWKRTRRAQDNMSPVRERDDSFKYVPYLSPSCQTLEF